MSDDGLNQHRARLALGRHAGLRSSSGDDCPDCHGYGFVSAAPNDETCRLCFPPSVGEQVFGPQPLSNADERMWMVARIAELEAREAELMKALESVTEQHDDRCESLIDPGDGYGWCPCNCGRDAARVVLRPPRAKP